MSNNAVANLEICSQPTLSNTDSQTIQCKQSSTDSALTKVNIYMKALPVYNKF